MERRELLKNGAALALVATIPEFLSVPLPAQVPKLRWMETPSAIEPRSTMESLIKKNPKGKIHGLSPAEWDQLGDAHQAFFAAHVENLARADTVIRANEAYLKTKYDHDAVNLIVRYGSYALLAQAPRGFHQVAWWLRTEPYAPASFSSCSGQWSTWAATALILGVFFPEIEPLMICLGLYYYAMDIFLCP